MGARESLRQIGQSRSFARGQHLMRPGAPSDDVLLIESGAVKVVLSAANGAESIVGFYGAGELIGEMGVMSGRPRSASVIAHVDGSALHVPAKMFRHLMETDREVLLLVNDTLERRLRSADHRALAIASRDVRTRVGVQLVAWGRTRGLHTTDGVLIRGMTQRDLAQTITASVKSVEAALVMFRDLNLVATSRCRFLLPDPGLLEHVLTNPPWRTKI